MTDWARHARTAFRSSGFAALTAASLPVFLARMALTPEAHKRRTRDRQVRAWAGRLLRLFGVEMHLSGTANLDGGVLVVANHRSAIDIGILLKLFGGRMVSRADLSSWPVLGPAARSTGTIFVDRTSRKSGANVVREIQSALQAGDTVSIFPEGTTFEGDEVRAFHGGAFNAARRAGVPIVPVGIAYAEGSDAAYVGTTFGQHVLTVAAANTIQVFVTVGDPCTPEGSRTFASELRDRVQGLVDDARARATLHRSDVSRVPHLPKSV